MYNGEDRWTSAGATNSLRVLVVVFTVRREKLRAITGGTRIGGPGKNIFPNEELSSYARKEVGYSDL